MRPALTNAQLALRSRWRAAFDGATTTQIWDRCRPERWHRLTEDAAGGGLGLGEPEAVLFAEELGFAAAGADVLDRLHLTPQADPRLRRCAYSLGLAQRAMMLATRRIRRRTQFGNPLSAYQGVTFPLVENSIRVDGVRLRLWQLAQRIDRGLLDAADLTAFTRLTDLVVCDAVHHAIHLHGAAGLTDDEPVSRLHRLLVRLGPAASSPTAATGPARDHDEHLRRALARRVPATWLGDTAEWAGPECLHELVSQAAHQYPAAPAVRMLGQDPLTYRNLDVRSARLAHHLRRRGAGSGTVVGLCLPRGIEQIITVLAILKTGAAYLPLDPDYPRERLETMVGDCRPVVVIGTPDGWTPAAVPFLNIEEALAAAGREPADQPAGEAGADDLAYVLYTSGSTGRPKGVEIEHRGVVNRLEWDRRTFPLGPGTAVLNHTSLNFDISVIEIFPPLISGAELVLAPPGAAKDPARLARLIAVHRITAICAVPSLLEAMLEEKPGLADATALKYVFAGGERLTAKLRADLFAALPWVQLHNFYGPTEASVDALTWRCTPEDHDEEVPIGRPLPNVRAYLVDDAGVPVARGETGELLVGGACLARGYRHAPEATRAKFLPDPFTTDPAARVYRTGDLARYRPDGAIEFLGRLDDQVKIRGFRVEPGEVEAALEAQPAVSQAVVHAHRGVRLHAWVTCRPDAPATAGTDLRARLAERLPEHLVPYRVDVLTEFPLMPNGKVDRPALTRRAEHGAEPTAGAADEETGQVLGLIREVLDGLEVGPDTDFFDAGGTSLQAARLVSRLRHRLGADLDLGQFLADPTCTGIVHRLRGAYGGVS